ncbi:MAG TPA: LytTR family DNA-binding domain-containing protein [Sphingomicrobium sp.]|nr:LytTR family DNA-binding domain-containing protein [Sphingomicrobium sp.]
MKRRQAFANPRRMRFTIRELTVGWKRHVLAAIGLGLLLAFLGPYGSGSVMGPAGRTLYWVGLVSAGYLLALAGFRLIGDRPGSVVSRAITVALLSALPLMFVVSWALIQVRPDRVISVFNLPMLFVAVLAIQSIIVTIAASIDALGVAGAAPSDGADEARQSVSGRLARSLRGDLVALEAEDHYVRLHHPSGSTLILHRFSDALAEVDPRAGLQVHRGWWVANGAVAGTFLRGGKRWLKLNNDLEIPVSRTYLRRVIEQNWPRIAA